ncbi:MAG: hypothetical protein NTY80_01315 [candidate division SR1 bacterium]|nr:hypothetical protein [candidate division SR1 bacterium]
MERISNKRSIKMIGLTIVGIFLLSTLLYLGTSFAATSSTDTTLGITVGTFSFFKDTGTTMGGYFVPLNTHLTGSSSASIDIGTYGASLTEIAATSSSDHRFTVSDMLGNSFTVTLSSSTLTAAGGLSIASSAITYTGTVRVGTGSPLTATGVFNTSLAAPVTFVSRSNGSGLSKFSQEITLKVQIPAAQAPASYTGQLTFTY